MARGKKTTMKLTPLKRTMWNGNLDNSSHNTSKIHPYHSEVRNEIWRGIRLPVTGFFASFKSLINNSISDE